MPSTDLQDTQNKSSFRRITKLGIPLLFAQLMHYFHQIADSAMLGHFGEESFELAAIGIAGLFTWILNTLLWPLSNGVQAITARRYGYQLSSQNENEELKIRTGEALDNGLFASAYIGLCALGLSFLARPILSALIQNEEILELCLQYIRIMRFALFPTGFFIVFQGFLGAINRTTYVMWSGIIGNLLNILLNYIFIFGKLNIPPLSIQGAAIGTAISWVVSCLFLLGIIVFKRYSRDYRLFTFKHLRSRMQRDIIRVALPPCIQNVFALSIFLVYQTLIEDYSTILLAATHTAFAFFRLNKTLIGGFARGTGILVGNAFGRNDQDDARRLMKSGWIIAGIIAFIIALVTIFGRGIIAQIFSSNSETQSATVSALLFFTPFFFIESLGYAFEMVFIANGYGKYVLLSELSTNLVFILASTVLVRFLYPDQIQLAWLSFGLYQIFHATFMIIAYKRGKWLNVEVDTSEVGK